MSWTVHGSRTVHDGSPWLRVGLVDVSAPKGERFEHAAIRIPDAAVALIVDEGEDPAEGRTQIRHRPAQTTTPGPSR